MPIPHPTIHDVVIAGAGPVGLFLACELRLAGLSVQVLEQAEHPHSPLKSLPFGMRGLSIPTLEAFYRRGLLDDLLAPRAAAAEADNAAPRGAHWMHQQRRPGGHFAGIQFFHDKIETQNWPYRLANPADTPMASDMACIESILLTRATMLGVAIRRRVLVSDLEQSDDGVRIRADQETFHGRWLVGCDGGRSTVRKAAGFAFVGTDAEFTGYSVSVTLDDADTLTPGRHFTANGMYTYQKPGIIAMVDFDGGAHHRRKDLSVEHVQAVLRRITDTDVTVSALHLATTWSDRAYQAAAYRKGRVLLAGDAAHIHSPLGGQGLNLGLGDAMNIGWKLAATVRGDAPDGLLDSYFSERHPVGRRVLDWSRAQVAVMRPTQSARALEALIRDLIETRDGATYFAERLWGVSLQYDLDGSHPLIGRSAPDFTLADGSRLAGHLTNGPGVLLDFDARKPLQALATSWGSRIVYVGGTPADSLGLGAVLVRPDGVVAWAAEGASFDRAELVDAVARWFGVP
ncbi:FAD-dependent monooxygenase [Robbsia sp. KACC 23696]|uniref:FAD-dependent monooxygenase n=1 Tax=Robbsia sp. KACC 23696 TaxID=3149231 RepID=UPI00325ABED4